MPLEVDTLSYRFQPFENIFVSTIVVKTKITSKAGHRIPDGCPSKNRVVLDVTATSDQGLKIFETSRIYMPKSTTSLDNAVVYGPDKKLGIIRDTSIQPFASKEETFEIKVPETVKIVNVVISLSYQLRPGDVYPIHWIIKKVPIESPRSK